METSIRINNSSFYQIYKNYHLSNTNIVNEDFWDKYSYILVIRSVDKSSVQKISVNPVSERLWVQLKPNIDKFLKELNQTNNVYLVFEYLIYRKVFKILIICLTNSKV